MARASATRWRSPPDNVCPRSPTTVSKPSGSVRTKRSTAAILAALREELRTTLVVIAYRLSTIRLADRVIFLEGGRVAATGSHDELIAKAPGYAAIIRAYERGER